MRVWHAIATVTAILVASGQTHAGLLDFTGNPNSNSTEWRTAVEGMGGTVNENVNFDTHDNTLLITDFYSASDGVTFVKSGDAFAVVNGVGPTNSNTSATPTSTGEGVHPSSNYLRDLDGVSSLTISFDAPVLGAGLFVIDYFSPTSNPLLTNPLEIEAFTGELGTGTSLGIVTSANFNFQQNYMYFMGVASSDNNIRSIVFRDTTETGAVDTIGLDNILFAELTVPEPSSIALLSVGTVVLAFAARRRRKALSTAGSH